MNLLFAINKNYIPVFLTCLKSVLKNGGAQSYAVYVLCSDLTREDEEAIRGAGGERAEFSFIYVDPAMFEGFPETKRYPRQIYYRIAAPLLLPQNLDRVLYLDGDTVVINSLENLYNSDFEGAYYMACTHTRRLLTKLNMARLGVEEEVPYINTGVMLFNLPKLRENLSMEQVRAYADGHKYRLLLPDQDIITALYGDKVKLLDSLIYNISDRTLLLHNADPKNPRLDADWVRKNSVVIHYFGKAKPWHAHYAGVLGVFYKEIAES